MFYVSAAAALSAKANMNIANIVCDLQCALVYVCVYVCVQRAAICAISIYLCHPWHWPRSSSTRYRYGFILYPLLPLSSSGTLSLCIMFWLLEKVMRLGNFLCHSVISIFKYSPSFVYAARKLFEAFFFFCSKIFRRGSSTASKW